MSLPRRTLVAAIVSASLPAAADDGGTPLARLAYPNHLGIMRHAIAPGGGDPPGLRPDDCTTQRNLDEAGRAQATRLGERLRAAGIADARVFTSQWCRTRDTAALLGLGTPQDLPLLNSFFADRAEGPSQTAALRRWIADAVLDAPTLLVTHQVNITALTGIFPNSGELLVLRRAADGLAVVARVQG